MYYQITGQGLPIVFIHGFCETLDIWMPFEQKLSENHQVILIDLPGFGKSELLQDNFTLADIAYQLKSLLDELKIEKYFMIGHSLGGYICLEFAKKYETSLLGFGLFNSTIFADTDEKKYIRDKTIQFVGMHGAKAFANTFVGNLFFEGNRHKFAEEIKTLTAYTADTNPNAINAFSKAMKARADSFDFWSQFQKPVFLIAGANDAGIPLLDSQQMIEAIVLGKGIIFSETGHMSFVEKEKESLAFILTFIKEELRYI